MHEIKTKQLTYRTFNCLYVFYAENNDHLNACWILGCYC